MHDYISLVPLFPLLGFIVLGLFGSYIKKESVIGIIASSTILASFLVTLSIFLDVSSNHIEEGKSVTLFTWIAAGDLNISVAYLVDRLSLLFTMVITGIGFLIHVYSVGYMHGDRSFYRFFAYLNLFVFMMLNLVLADNFLLTFFGWEGVGLASYLLIGFWYDQKFPGYRITWTGDAANKAFIVNRIGDFGFLIAMFLIFTTFGTLNYAEVNAQAFAMQINLYDTALITGITLLLFLACTGKSAQLPLAGWLPDAMAGPTSVSALIHAATMVTAGIFFIGRNNVLFSLAPVSMEVVAIVGAATAIIAASIGIVQNDIKKVLAYSTVSQLGFMFVALGVGAFSAGIFHVMTHAFFKGLLFLGAGSVIHGMHHEQNIKNMGGLKKYMPVTFMTFLIATLAISGIPPFSGFFSKDEILWVAFSRGNVYLWLTLSIAALFTAFYMFRLLYLTFYGKERFDHHHHHPHESPKLMTVPLMVLAVLSALGGFLGVPHALSFHTIPNLVDNWLHPIFANANSILKVSHGGEVHAEEYILMITSTVVAIIAIFVAKSFYSNKDWATPRALVSKFSSAYNILVHKWFIDEIYYGVFVTPIYNFSLKGLWKNFDVNIVDGIVNGAGGLTKAIANFIRRMQSGVAQNYATMMMFGILVIITLLIINF